MYRAAFPDVRISVDDVIAADDKVVLRWRSEGTHRGELAGLAPTGARASVTGIGIDRWKDGKVVESWSEWDTSVLPASSAPRHRRAAQARRSERPCSA
jgi:predicted ester cyclase